MALKRIRKQYASGLSFLFIVFVEKSREWKEKFDLVDDDVEDTLMYHYKNKFNFRRDLSGPGLTGNEIITMPHPCTHSLAFSDFRSLFCLFHSFFVEIISH